MQLELPNAAVAAWLEGYHSRVKVVRRISHSEADVRKLHNWRGEGRRFDDVRAVSGEPFEFQNSIAYRASILIAR